MKVGATIPIWRLERLWTQWKRYRTRRTRPINFDQTTGHEAILRELNELPNDWHGAGVCGLSSLRAITLFAQNRRILNSAETGVGKSTILLSHLSENHTVFALDDTGSWNSLQQVRDSRLLKSARVNFIVGPTQQTLPKHTFTNRLQLVFIDGPHGYPFPELEYYFFYPHLDEDGLLIVDDIHIPTIFRLFSFLREERMFDFLGIASHTAFFRRNSVPLFDPIGDGWWLQDYNRKRFPIARAEQDFLPADVTTSAEFKKLMVEVGH